MQPGGGLITGFMAACCSGHAGRRGWGRALGELEKSSVKNFKSVVKSTNRSRSLFKKSNRERKSQFPTLYAHVSRI